MPRVYYGDRLSVGEIQPIIDVSYKYHALSRPLSAIELIDPAVLRSQ